MALSSSATESAAAAQSVQYYRNKSLDRRHDRRAADVPVTRRAVLRWWGASAAPCGGGHRIRFGPQRIPHESDRPGPGGALAGDSARSPLLLDNLPKSNVAACISTMKRLMELPFLRVVQGGHDGSFGHDRLLEIATMQ